MKQLFARGLVLLMILALLTPALALAEESLDLLEEAVANIAPDDTLLLLDGVLDNAPAATEEELSLLDFASEAPKASNGVVLSYDDRELPIVSEGLRPNESNADLIELTVKYTGVRRSKVYDATIYVTKDGVESQIGVFKREEFTVTGIQEEHPDVSLKSIQVLQSFKSADVGKYNLKFGFKLQGEDAEYYKEPTVWIPAKITRRPVIVTPYRDQGKVYGEEDPSIGRAAMVSGLIKDHYTITGNMTRDKGEGVGRYRIRLGTLDFGNSNYSVKIKKAYFTIHPKGTSLKTLTGGKKSIIVTWKKQPKQVTGYQIEYSTDSYFENSKTVKVKGANTVKKKLTKLETGKEYFVRIRTYFSKSGKTYYSDWSEFMSATTK